MAVVIIFAIVFLLCEILADDRIYQVNADGPWYRKPPIYLIITAVSLSAYLVWLFKTF